MLEKGGDENKYLKNFGLVEFFETFEMCMSAQKTFAFSRKLKENLRNLLAFK